MKISTRAMETGLDRGPESFRKKEKNAEVESSNAMFAFRNERCLSKSRYSQDKRSAGDGGGGG